MEEKDLTMIQLVSLPSCYKNFVSSLSVGKDSITLEEKFCICGCHGFKMFFLLVEGGVI